MQLSDSGTRAPSGASVIGAQLFRQPWVLAGAVALLAIVAYAPVMMADSTIWDDEAFLGNPLLRSGRGLLDIWVRPRANQLEEHYWPVTYTVAWMVTITAGAPPAAFHALNVLLHAANAALVYGLLRRVAPAAACGAILFAVHPVNVESVAWIVELKNVLSLGLAVLALLLYLEFERCGRARIAATSGWLLFVLAALAKTAVLPWAVVVPLLFWAMPDGWTPQRRRFAFGLLSIALAVGLFDVWYTAGGDKVVPTFSIVQRLAITGPALAHYLRTWIWPTGLCAIYAKWPLTPGSLCAGLLIDAVVIFTLGILLWKARTSARRRWAFVWAAGTLAMLLPALGLISFTYQRQAYVADRFAYHASPVFLAGLVAAAGAALARRPAVHVWLRAATVALAAILGTATFVRAGVWRSAADLARDTVAKNPRAWTARYYLADHLARRGAFEEATGHFSAVFWGSVEELTEADLQVLERNSTARPGTEARAAFNRGLLAARRGDLQTARVAFQQAASDPQLRARALLAVAALALQSGRRDEAITTIRSLYGSPAP